jgi:hypothetical protein
MEHYNARIEVVRSTARLFGAGGLLNGIDPSLLPSYEAAMRSQMNLAFNVIGLGPGLQEVGTLVAAATCWGLFFDEINKFFWWPLHLSGYVLVVVPIPTPCSSACTCCGQPRYDQRRPSMGAGRPRRDPHSCRDLPGPGPDRHLRQHLTQVAPLALRRFAGPAGWDDASAQRWFRPTTSLRDGARDPVGDFAEVTGQLGRSAHFELAAQVQDL